MAPHPSHVTEAAASLWQHRLAGTVLDALPPAWRPADALQGHAIQAELPRVAQQPVVGWKIAATSAAGQAHINVGGPIAGRILSSFVFEAGATLPLAGNRMRVAEPEFGFRIGAPLRPRAQAYGMADVLTAVASLHPSFELPDSRFADFTRAGEAQLIADDACCGLFVLGAAAPASWRDIDLPRHAVHAVVRDAAGRTRLERSGEGSAALGDPRIALVWLVNQLSSLGITLEAGQFVSTGTCMQPLAIAPGDRVEADYGVLGRLAMSLML
jgi:2-keto-4-pentenoate hydratase